MKKKTTQFTRSVSKMRMEMVKEALSDTALMTKDLAAAVFITPTQAREYINYLTKRKRIYIKAYKRDVRDHYKRYQPLYAWGKGEDAEKPKRLSEAERNRLRRMNPKNREKERLQRLAKRMQLKQANDNTMQVAA